MHIASLTQQENWPIHSRCDPFDMRWPSDPCSLSDPSAFSNVIDVLYVLSKPRTYVWVCYFLPRFHRSPIWFWAGGFGICTIRYPLIKFMVDRCFLWLSILLVTLSGRCGWWCIGLQGSALFADCAAVVRSSGSSAAHLCIFILHTGTFWGSSFRVCHDPVAPDKNNTNKLQTVIYDSSAHWASTYL